RLEVFGFAMTDLGYNFGTSNPDWYDVVRPTKLPSFRGEFGEDGRVFLSVRQSRLGLKSYLPLSMGELRVHLEAELFGVGDDAGRTTFRLRHAFGELGMFGAGQTWSGFMDPDVFPNSVEYWGPNGMVFFRNVQVRWRLVQGGNRFQVSLENPGGSADVDDYEGRVELQDVTPRFQLPDVTAQYRYTGDFGHVQLAGIFRYVRWDDLGTDAFDLSGDAIGWGVNLSSNIKLPLESVLKLQLVYGEAIQNYMNDAAVDIAVRPNPTNALRPLEGVPLPTLGTVVFLDLNWTDWVTSTVGHSFVWVNNSEGQGDTAFHIGQYALANVLFKPTKDFLVGPELQWGQRRNFRDGFVYDAYRIQLSMKYSFADAFQKPQ
ncbi:MAG: DcaP family trimeric outer membrane transporter, partial [Myxococcaceae bacterium]